MRSAVPSTFVRLLVGIALALLWPTAALANLDGQRVVLTYNFGNGSGELSAIVGRDGAQFVLEAVPSDPGFFVLTIDIEVPNVSNDAGSLVTLTPSRSTTLGPGLPIVSDDFLRFTFPQSISLGVDKGSDGSPDAFELQTNFFDPAGFELAEADTLQTWTTQPKVFSPVTLPDFDGWAVNAEGSRFVEVESGPSTSSCQDAYALVADIGPRGEGVVDGFQMVGSDGRRYVGTYQLRGKGNRTLKISLDDASINQVRKSIKDWLLTCRGLNVRVKLEKLVVTGKVNRKYDRMTLKVKVVATLVGKGANTGYRADIKYKAKVKSTKPAACLAAQGETVYPPPQGGLLGGWVELTTIEGSDNYYLIFSEDFLSILRDFQMDFQSIAALLELVDRFGGQCEVGDRTVVTAVELNATLGEIVAMLEDFERAIQGVVEAVRSKLIEPLVEIIAAEIAGAMFEAVFGP